MAALNSCLVIPPDFCKTNSTPNNERLMTVTGYVTSKENAAPIKNIKITGDYGYTRTDATGYYELLVYLDKKTECAIIVFEDDDGVKNEGKFKKMELTVKDRKYDQYKMPVLGLDVQLEKEGAE